MRERRRTWVAAGGATGGLFALGGLGGFAGCAAPASRASSAESASSPASQAPASAILVVHAAEPGPPVNPLILGNNIDWSHSAQGLVKPGSNQLVPAYLALADRLAPTALRYPGGTNSDFHHWRNGVGPYAQRRPNKTLEGKEEVIGLGTDEYLALCRRWKSEPLITVNLATGRAEDAAEWVRYTNRRAGDLPRVRYWEIGNEPYLEAHFKEARMTPGEYAQRVNAFMRAMKAVDPDIEAGVALRNDTLGGVESTPFKGFIDTVLKGVREPFEFAALHSSYFPVTFEKKESERDLFTATMAGVREMLDDMEATRAKLRVYHPGRRVKLAITEYNALYSLDILRWGLASVFLSKTDRYIESLAGALFVADVLRVLSETDDLLMANFWSLCGNWWYGAISHEGKPRPQYHVLEAYREFAQGSRLRCAFAGVPTMDTARSGFVRAHTGVPAIDGHAVRSGDVVRVALINRHPERALPLVVRLPGVGAGKATVRQLTARHYFAEPVAWQEQALQFANGQVALTLPRHSFAVLRVGPG